MTDNDIYMAPSLILAQVSESNPLKNHSKIIILCYHLKVHTVGLNYHMEINIILITITLKNFSKQLLRSHPQISLLMTILS